jgi:hypothetical protein
VNPRIETRTPDVVREWYFDERVVVFVIKNSDRETVNRFADWIIETVAPWPPDKPLLIAYHVEASIFTPHARQRTLDIYAAIPPDIHGRTALVLPNSPFGNFMKIFANKLMRVTNPRMERRFFVSLDDAIAWLNAYN